jgi:ElaB/YqjD/DUF883 family membrane-anchored ribosome-binding protein
MEKSTTSSSHGSENGRRSGRLVALAEESERIWEDLARLILAAQRAGGEVQAVVEEALEKRPYVTIATAAATGYVLGGGLPYWATRWMMGTAGRITTMVLIQRLMAAADGSREPSAEAADAGARP